LTNILYIAYQFPPLNIGGTARPAKFAKHLNEFGINPVVITLHPDDYGKVYPSAKSDSGVLKNLDKPLEIINIHTEDLLQRSENKLQNFLEIYFNIYRGNEKKYWEANYQQAVDKYLLNNKVAAIVVTAPPFSMLPLALNTSFKHKLPLIVDMRDPWTMWNMSPYSNYFNFVRAKLMERKVFRHALKIIATSKVTLDDFKTLHPSIEASKFEYIPNGYEHQIHFKDIVYQPKETITIGYVGSFYYSPESREQIFKKWWQKKGHRMLQYIPRHEDWLYRSPYPFFKTLTKLFEANSDLRSKVMIKFAGKKEPWFEAMVSEFGLEANVTHMGWLSQDESLQFQKSCDFLLMTSAKVIGGRDYSIAGKTFEYFTIQKPILAFVAEGAQKDLLMASEMAHILSIDDTETAAEDLHKIFTTAFTFKPNAEFINSFHIQPLTKRFTEVINSVIKND
jgi:glycosyltransferase involved in cell wall biosynthesis